MNPKPTRQQPVELVQEVKARRNRYEKSAGPRRCGRSRDGLGVAHRPSLVGRLLLGEELTGIAIPVARVAGIALIALGIVCWPGTPLVGMLTYSAAVTLYLAYVGFAGGLTGILLWPAVVLHVILTAFLIWALTSDKETKT